MNKTLTVFAFAFAALLPAGAALADDNDCAVPRSQWQPREAALQVARDTGWTVHDFEVDDGCYEIEGRDGDGRKIEVKLDPATLQIVVIDHEDDDERGGASNPAPSGSVAPPKNGLFGNGAPPRVQMN
ncbi:MULTISPECIES: PepSY domain-containing protein [Parvibaculum]|uniref:PepSY domain-containing protein n=1 Tax=Parvibaculum TaxID=256616 RepID=UPI000C922E0B|nr:MULTISPECIES: PepSY domain-containing protein [Parvibaculum]MAB15296.1 hypothetical protein [Parvibaculum sp.]NIJ41684.1 hypothetical protein [Parvibaculum indicum]